MVYVIQRKNLFFFQNVDSIKYLWFTLWTYVVVAFIRMGFFLLQIASILLEIIL